MDRSDEKEQFWRLVLDEHAKSGLNAREFCRRESLSLPSFYSWRRKIRQRDTGDVARRLLPVSVVEESPKAEESTTDMVEIVAPGEIVVRFHNDCSIDAMSRIFTAVRQSWDDASC